MAWRNGYSTKYMQLELPIPGVTPGPDWALMINEAFWKIDSHDHSGPGKGRQVLSSAIVIDGDLDFGDDGYYNGINRAKYFQFLDISASAGTPGNAGALFCYKNDLWWQYSSTGGTAGTFCQITSYSRPVSVTQGFESVHIYDATYEIGSLEKISAVFVSSQPTTITLPNTGGLYSGRYYLIQDRAGTANTNNITITANAYDSIAGGTAGGSVTINTAYGYKWLIADKSNDRWLILTEA